MQRILLLLIMLFVVATLAGCAGNGEMIKAMSMNTRQDVFQELSAATPTPLGYSDLRIVSSLKTHMPGIYSAKDIHGTPEYMLLINVDGQAVQIAGSLRTATREPQTLRDPEAGEGMRYLFQKELRLKPGRHRIFASLPFEGIAVERVIELAEGSRNTLVLEPVYGSAPEKQRPGFYGVRSFKEGIRGFWVTYNGKSL
ncbi:MAG: hypothetical protein FD174_4144 [Geobacteraceae bacterium]|nr:MAG: hypothetical protein FD174_4144 [Geobacteraceae bacterium]